MDFDDSFSTLTAGFIDLDIDVEDIEPDISHLSEEEIRAITKVIEEDKNIKREDRARRRRIEETIDERIIEISMKNIDDGDKFCSNCGEKFRLLINPRQICSKCNKGVCNDCMVKITDEKRICKLCNLEAYRESKTGKWFVSTSKENKRFRKTAASIIMNSFKKKKKFSAPPIPNGDNKNLESFKSNDSKHTPLYLPKNDSLASLRRDDDSFRNNSGTHTPIYIRKIDSPTSVKKETIKTIESSPKEILVDVVDMGDGHIDSHIPNNTIERKSKNHLGSNLLNSKALSASSTSIYSETFESYKSGLIVSGEILFSVQYDESKKTLSIFVDQCKNLAVADRSKRQTNPYIKTYLLPDKTKLSKKKSSCKKSSVNPVFKETLVYYVSKENLSSITLSVAVWHQRFLTYNYFLGEVHILLADMNLTENELIWYPLQEKMRYANRSGSHIHKGELIIKLKYKQSSRKDGKGSLYVYIVEAQQLESDEESLNAYVKGYLLPDRSNKTKKKTPVQKGKSNIKWNSLLQFTDVDLEELKDRSLELSVYHYRRLKSNEFLGGVRLNHGLGHVSWMDAQGAEKETWESFLSNPNEDTEAILRLRPNLEF